MSFWNDCWATSTPICNLILSQIVEEEENLRVGDLIEDLLILNFMKDVLKMCYENVYASDICTSHLEKDADWFFISSKE